MTLIRTKTALYCLGLVVMLPLIASCGHGGGGGPTHPSSVGTYLGTADLTISAAGKSATGTGLGIQFVVSPNNTVSVGDPGEPPVGTGPLTGDTFAIAAPGSFLNSPEVSCVGSVAFNGTLSGATMSGTIGSSGLVCNGVPVVITGTFTATLRAELPRQSVGTGAMQTLRNAVRLQ